MPSPRTLWHAWQQRRQWRREMKDVPLHQLRGNVHRQAFYQNPAKQRWAARWLWRREKLWNNPGVMVGIVSLIVTVIGVVGVRWLFGWF